MLDERTVTARRRSFEDVARLGARPSTASGCGRSRTAGTSPARSSGSCSRAAKRSCGSRPSSPPARAARAREPRQVRRHRRRRDRARRAARRPRHVCRSRGWPARSSRSGCSSITASGSSRSAPQLINDLRWHLHDLWPETRDPAPRADRRPLAGPHRRSPHPRRADRSRPDRPRRAAPHPRAHPHNQRPRARARRPRRRARAAAARRTRLRRPHRRQADRRDRRRPAASPPTPSSPAPPARHRSPPPPDDTHRHRLDRGGNRQLNCALHRLAITKGRLDPETAAYLARKQAEGKTRREAIRCLKRHLARRVWHLLQPDPATTIPTSTPARPARAAITIHCNIPDRQPLLDIEATSVAKRNTPGRAPRTTIPSCQVSRLRPCLSRLWTRSRSTGSVAGLSSSRTL